MFAWFVKLISGLIPTGVNSDGKPKSFGEWSGKIAFVVIIVLVFFVVIPWIVEKLFPNKPNVTNIGEGGKQIIYTSEPMVAHFGCSAWKANARVWIAK